MLIVNYKSDWYKEWCAVIKRHLTVAFPGPIFSLVGSMKADIHAFHWFIQSKTFHGFVYLLYCLNRFWNAELDALEADMGMETEADGVPSYLQPDKEPDLDAELNLPSAPTGNAAAAAGRANAQVYLTFKLLLFCSTTKQ